MHTLEQLRSGALAGATRVKLACGLTEFPREIFDLADSLEILDLSGNALSALPNDLPRLHKLRILFCSDNQFTELPAVLGQCQQLTMVGFKANQIRRVPADALPRGLRWLILTDNQVQALPAEIGECTQLQKLMLAGNQLHSLPAELAHCTRLELVRIAANRLTEFPAVLLTLPRLAWLAFADNPFCAALETTALNNTATTGLAWMRLQMGHVLGEGASGVIHHAHLHGLSLGAAPQPVAVKLFKGAVTSDGLPQCEMAACMRAGVHRHLIPVLGRVVHHPSGVNGLVMELIETEFVNLAGPPSLDSCTRDVYAPNQEFGASVLLGIARGMASAAQHLHAQGLMHGDLYAHNILHNGQGVALLGDFGAASFYAPEDAALANALQRIEVRAFACLLEELLVHSPGLSGESALYQGLAQLRNQCFADDGATRPLFHEIEQTLRDLMPD
jgi:hypothetical protein